MGACLLPIQVGGSTGAGRKIEGSGSSALRFLWVKMEARAAEGEWTVSLK